jgi:hypothetical protein
MKDFSAFSVSNYFGFEPRVDEELQPGIMISKPVGVGGMGGGGWGGMHIDEELQLDAEPCKPVRGQGERWGGCGFLGGAPRALLPRNGAAADDAYRPTSHAPVPDPALAPPSQGPLQPLAEEIKSAVQGAGAALERMGQRTLGQHILAFVDARKQAG